MRAIIYDSAEKKWLSFTEPAAVFSSFSIDHVQRVLKSINRKVLESKLYAAGFISYQASPAFDRSLNVKPDYSLIPLISFALYSKAEEIDSPALNNCNQEPFSTGPWNFSITEDVYKDKIVEIKKYLEAGNTYQVNFTLPLKADFYGCPFSFFSHLLPDAKVKYAAYIESDDYAICSFSPELFFIKQGKNITMKPMKGTAPRGITPEDDRQKREWLADSEKNRAENLMITDMIRNDVSRIAERGSVKVIDAFTIETYPTLFQMTSTVTAETDASLPEIFKALFPCASITGAPKVSTMMIIEDLEPEARGIYTGSIGLIKPGGDALFNVAIRTVTIDKKKQKGTYGVGGGIVWDSDPEEEYKECLTKCAIIRRSGDSFFLFETIKYSDGEFFLLHEHLERIKSSANYYRIPFSRDDAVNKLAEAVKGSEPRDILRIKFMLRPDGNIEIAASPLTPLPEPYIITVASAPLDRENPFLYHKTSVRRMYNEALTKSGNYNDVIIFNKEMELTESTIANIVLRFNEDLYTPPVSCGLLPGTMRSSLIKSGRIKERVLYLNDLEKANEIFLINSLRGWIKPLLKL